MKDHLIEEIDKLSVEELKIKILREFDIKYRLAPENISVAEKLFQHIIETPSYNNELYNWSMYGNKIETHLTIFEPWELIHIHAFIKHENENIENAKALLISRVSLAWNFKHKKLIKKIV